MGAKEKDDPWCLIQVFTSVANHLGNDEEARETLTHAVGETSRRGIDGNSWVARHLRLADRLSAIGTQPESINGSGRVPRVGDLVILKPKCDPRVRIVLEVVPSRDSHLLTVLDPTHESGKTKFLATHVDCVEWEHGEVLARR